MCPSPPPPFPRPLPQAGDDGSPCAYVHEGDCWSLLRKGRKGGGRGVPANIMCPLFWKEKEGATAKEVFTHNRRTGICKRTEVTLATPPAACGVERRNPSKWPISQAMNFG